MSSSASSDVEAFDKVLFDGESFGNVLFDCEEETMANVGIKTRAIANDMMK
jgi:hypothetical protein